MKTGGKPCDDRPDPRAYCLIVISNKAITLLNKEIMFKITKWLLALIILTQIKPRIQHQNNYKRILSITINIICFNAYSYTIISKLREFDYLLTLKKIRNRKMHSLNGNKQVKNRSFI